MITQEVTVKELRDNMAEQFNLVRYRDCVKVVLRHGKPVCVLMSCEMFEKMEKLYDKKYRSK